MITGNQGVVKQWNKWLVLNTVRRYDGISRADVARETGLNSATVSNLTAELLAGGLVEEQGRGTSNGGRRPIMLRVNPSGLFAAGVEIQPWGIRSLVVNLSADVIARREQSLPAGVSAGELTALIADGVQEVLRDAGIPLSKTVGVGVAVPGIADQARGTVLQSTPLGWQDLPLGTLLGERIGLPVTIERDCLAASVGELWYGAGRGHRDLVFLLIDMGVGAGVVVDRKAIRGAHGGSGQIGHMTVDFNGPRCTCGNYGCLESFASGRALLDRLVTAQRLSPADQWDIPAQPDLPALLHAARDGNRLASQLLEEAGRYLGLALANIINLYDPEVVILGGAIPLGSPQVCTTMVEMAKARALHRLTGQVGIVLPHFGAEACAVGAATLVFERLLGPVQVVTV